MRQLWSPGRKYTAILRTSSLSVFKNYSTRRPRWWLSFYFTSFAVAFTSEHESVIHFLKTDLYSPWPASLPLLTIPATPTCSPPRILSLLLECRARLRKRKMYFPLQDHHMSWMTYFLKVYQYVFSYILNFIFRNSFLKKFSIGLLM